MILGGVFIFGIFYAFFLYGTARVLDLFCAGILIAGIGLMIYYGAFLQN